MIMVFDFQDIADMADDLQPSKWSVNSVTGRFYDPLGYMSPSTIQFNIFLQELCKSRMSWDEKLSGELLEHWKRLVDQLRAGNPMHLPRCCLSSRVNESTQYRLYGFCDASVKA